MIFNTTAAQIIDRSLSLNMHSVLLKQLFYAFVGVIVGSLLFRWGYERFLEKSFWFLGLGTLLLVFLFIPGIGQTINGARRWIYFFGFSFQPSEWMKLFLPAAYIRWVMQEKNRPILFSSFLKLLALFSIPLALILLQPDNGTTLILLSLLFVLFLLTKVPLHYWFFPFLIFALSGALIGYQMPHVKNRLEVYLHPELDLKGKGHQPFQAKIAAGSGGLLGRGLGESIQKLNYLPEARNDYIAAIFAEEMGFLGILFLISLYLLLTYGGFMIAIRAKDLEGVYLASIATFLIAIQAFLNLGIVSGLLPSKGMTLPFFSQGGTSLIVNLVLIFLLIDISRKSKQRANVF